MNAISFSQFWSVDNIHYYLSKLILILSTVSVVNMLTTLVFGDCTILCNISEGL